MRETAPVSMQSPQEPLSPQGPLGCPWGHLGAAPVSTQPRLSDPLGTLGVPLGIASVSTQPLLRNVVVTLGDIGGHIGLNTTSPNIIPWVPWGGGLGGRIGLNTTTPNKRCQNTTEHIRNFKRISRKHWLVDNNNETNAKTMHSCASTTQRVR